MSNNLGIVGNDGFNPTHFNDALWRTFSSKTVFAGMPAPGANKYIPNVDDHIVDPETNKRVRVINRNSNGSVITVSVDDDSNNSGDPIFSETKDSYRIYQDTSVSPTTLSVDGLLFRTYDSRAFRARIYKGADYSDSANPISEYIDSSGASKGYDIPLDLLADNSHSNYAIKTVRTCNLRSTIEPLMDGELCTIVVYTDDNKVIHRASALIENSSFIKQAHADQYYITNLYLDTPYINMSDDTIINVPSNLNINDFDFNAVVVRNDGSKETLPVEPNGKFTIAGLDQINTSVKGDYPVVLIYSLDPDEVGISTILTNDGPRLTRPYTLRVTEPDKLYGVKLFPYLYWDDVAGHWKHRVHMLSLDRSEPIDVTDKIVTENGTQFPTHPNSAQGDRVDMKLNLNDVSPSYAAVTYTQSSRIHIGGLMSNSTFATDPKALYWTIVVDMLAPNQDVPYGGRLDSSLDTIGLKAVRYVTDQDKHQIRIDNGATTWSEFKALTYDKTFPLFNPQIEEAAPQPVTMRLRYGNTQEFIRTGAFRRLITLTEHVELLDNIILDFYTQVGSGRLYLSTVEMIVRD